eukprot:gene36247-43971_t
MAGEDVTEELLRAEQLAEKLKTHLHNVNEEYNQKFNKYWGQLFKAGNQDSRFAKQVMDYACLYTSRASNLAFIYPNRRCRPKPDFLPHDQYLVLTGIGNA